MTVFYDFLSLQVFNDSVLSFTRALQKVGPSFEVGIYDIIVLITLAKNLMEGFWILSR